MQSEVTRPAQARRRDTEEFTMEAGRWVRASAHPVAQVARAWEFPTTCGIAGAPRIGRPRSTARPAWLNAPKPRHSRV